MSRVRRNQILVGDSRQLLRHVPDASVDCVITSPPYFRLRNYQHAQQIGLEGHVDDWMHELRLVLREVKRVLKPTGSMWLNVGDTYSRETANGALPKSLLLAPERIALALLADGWLIRNKVIWAKTNPLPTSVKDRLSCTYESFYFATKQRNYCFDLDAIRVPHVSRAGKGTPRRPAWTVPDAWRGPAAGSNSGLGQLKAAGLVGHPRGKNPGDVWQLPTAAYRGAHHAVFPEALVRRPLLASCPERTCRRCGAAWRRDTARSLGRLAVVGALRPACACAVAWQPGLVLDPFFGSGTVGVAAQALGRDWLGIEVNPAFAALAHQRLVAAVGREPPAAAA